MADASIIGDSSLPFIVCIYIFDMVNLINASQIPRANKWT